MAKSPKPGVIPLDALCFPVASATARLREEQVPYIKVHRLIDAFEVLVKYLVACHLFSARTSEPDTHQPQLQGLFVASILRPSLGTWVGYLRQLVTPKAPLPCWHYLEDPFFAESVKALKKCQLDFDDLTNLRNRYGHGAVKESHLCEADLEQYLPAYERALCGYRKLLELPLYSREKAGGQLLCWRGANTQAIQCPTLLPDAVPVPAEIMSPFFVLGGRIVSLFPLLYMPGQQAQFFYNTFRDLKKGRMEYLDYVSGMHREDSEGTAPQFLLHFPQGQETSVDATALRREEYVAGFIGREDEMKGILEFLGSHSCGFFIVWGGPGVGKGALLSKLENELSNENWRSCLPQTSQASEYPGGARAILLTTLLEQSDSDPTNLLVGLVGRLAHALGMSMKASQEISVLKDTLKQLLNEASRKKQPVILILDGLDECLRGGEEVSYLLNSLPSHMPEFSYLVLSSRPVPRVRNFWLSLDPLHRAELTLQGLPKESVQELLCRSWNKYEVLSHVSVVDAMCAPAPGSEDRQGNPLFVKLVLSELVRGQLSMDGLARIPHELSTMYARFLERTPERALQVLYAIAGARRAVSPAQLSLLLERDIDGIAADISAIGEMVVENPETECIEDYSVFHRSLIDHLLRYRPEKLAHYTGLWLNHCRNWPVLVERYRKSESLGERVCIERRAVAAYAFHHLGDYLLEAAATASPAERRLSVNELVQVIDNAAFREHVFGFCGSLTPLQRMIEGTQALLVADDVAGANMRTMIRLAFYYADERHSFARLAAESLTVEAARGDWLRALSLIEMADTAAQRVFLAIRSLRAMTPEHRAHARPVLNRRLKQWLRYEPDVNLEHCYEKALAHLPG